MIVRRAILLSLLLWPPSTVLNASTLVLRDSIGPDSSLTDGMVGVINLHDGLDWDTPGLVVNVPADGELTQARFVIFAYRSLSPEDHIPENDLANIYGYPMDFHVWTDGIEGGADSFDENPIGNYAVPGHININVNHQFNTGFITVEPFGHTGPPETPNMFTTFLVTIDLSSFDIALQADTEYVMGITQGADNFITFGGFFRISGSRATGFEDVFQTNLDTGYPEYHPGYIDSQHEFGFEQYAGSFTLGNGDYDADDDVDGLDFLRWQRNFGQAVPDAEDSNGDGIADGDDLTIWETQYGQSWPAPLAAEAASPVPEPNALLLTMLGSLMVASGRRLLRSPHNLTFRSPPLGGEG